MSEVLEFLKSDEGHTVAAIMLGSFLCGAGFILFLTRPRKSRKLKHPYLQ